MASNGSTYFNPFFNFDFTKMMASFDPTKMAGDFAKMAEQYKVPGVDLDALMAVQRENLQALEAANRKAMEGFQALAKRQAEFLNESVQETQSVFDTLSKAKSAQDVAAKQVDFLKAAYEKSFENLRELTEMATDITTETSEVINTRIAAGLDEMKKQTTKSK